MELISIIIPIYNCEKYLSVAIESVIKQTYTKWEILLMYDVSIDTTLDIAYHYQNCDQRIKVYQLDQKLGCGHARNVALQYVKGEYIAYLDADDLWKPQKLEKQINFMKEHNVVFSCTNYEVIDDQGISYHKEIGTKSQLSYKSFLTHNLIQILTVMIDIRVIDKELLVTSEDVLIEDLYMWVQILKQGYICYGIDENLAKHRRVESSLSARSKINQIRGMWYLYRAVAEQSFLKSTLCLTRYAFLAVWKRLYPHNISFKELQK